ncbi:MAG: hypothetical protein JXN59_13570, partial [Anaerolineae bacterium]|nr:hypothetical protein [Anaerolineae bacterium]
MTVEARTALLVIAIMGGYLLLAGLVLGRLLRPAARRVLIGLALVAAFLVSMHLLTRDQQTFWGWFFHPSVEMAAGAIFSS